MNRTLQERETGSTGDPFRATQLWKDAIFSFRANMPRRRRRVKMHFYDNCFSGPEAVHWLHNHLQMTGIFGTDIARHQVEKLLQKFLTSKVIEEVRGKPGSFEEEESCCLYRFVTEPGPFNFVEDENSAPGEEGGSVMETSSSSLGKRKRKESSFDNDDTCFSNEFASTSCDEESFTLSNMSTCVATPEKRHRDASCSGPVCTDKCSSPWLGESFAREPLPSMVAKVWKEITLNKLLLLIELPSLDGVLTHDAVDGKHIVHNVGSVARLVGRACSSAAQTCLAAAVLAGPSTSSKPRPQTPGRALAPASHVTRRRSLHMKFHKLQDWSGHTHKSTEEAEKGFPHWVTLSMHCLSKWPYSCSEEFLGDMPIYGGFELDVFQSLVDFFRMKSQPLISTALYNIFMAILRLIRTNHAHSAEAMQLCCLLLPQQNRLRLHSILRFIDAASTNQQLYLSKTQSNLSVLLDRFASVILRKPCKSAARASEINDDHRTLVAFMADRHQSLFNVPEDLRSEVKERIKLLKDGKGSPMEMKHVFCQQLSTAEYEEQGVCHSHYHMTQLLEGILANTNMKDKEKISKLKMFQKQYPEIYHKRFQEKPHPLAERANENVGGVKFKMRRPKLFHTSLKLASLSHHKH